nr:hypothetical protein [Saccharopolyspora hordei]
MRTATGVALAAVGLLATAVPAATAAPEPDPLDPANFELRPDDQGDAVRDAVARLDAELPRVTVSDVLAEANRTAEHDADGACNAGAIDDDDADELPDVAESFCFQSGDDDVRYWYPQGVTTAADAQGGQLAGPEQAILVSWYDHEVTNGPTEEEEHENGIEKGVRITFLDKQTNAYRHVLLAYPVIDDNGAPSYRSVLTGQDKSLHAGGIVWYGDFLYVADTAAGFRVFDMRHIYDLGAASNGTTEDPDKIGRHDGTYHGHGYRYVMPQVAAWEVTAAQGTRCSAEDEAMVFSYVSLDRSTPDHHLIAGEYCDQNQEVAGRAAAWRLADSLDDRGEQITDPSHLWRADEVHRLEPTNVQGALRVDGRWYLSKTNGPHEAGENDNSVLYLTERDPGEVLAPAAQEPAPVGAEDLALWPTADGGHDVWSVSEYPGGRMVYSLHVAAQR